MSDAEVRELLSWIARRPRSYPEAIEVWKTNCPRHSLWEDALGDGLIEVVRKGSRSHVALTSRGKAALAHRAASIGSPRVSAQGEQAY
jgi:hypothetical protein